jgi:tRNA (guanine37-N1)-methyltransferase
MFQGPLDTSLLKKARDKGLFSFTAINLRDYTSDRHKTADDTPYGGGSGMVMKVDVLVKALRATKDKGQGKVESRKQIADSRKQEVDSRVILFCPTGIPLTQEKVNELAQLEHLILLCGHYEGVDERVRDYVDEEISIGDYVLTGGEIPALVLIDAVVRQIPGVVKEETSVQQDSFYAGRLDYPSYTRPEEFEGKSVPNVLLSGHHAEIEKWRHKEALKQTLRRRPDLLANKQLSPEDQQLLGELLQNG